MGQPPDFSSGGCPFQNICFSSVDRVYVKSPFFVQLIAEGAPLYRLMMSSLFMPLSSTTFSAVSSAKLSVRTPRSSK